MSTTSPPDCPRDTPNRITESHSLDEHNTARLVTAIRHAAGKRPGNADLNSSRLYDIF
jgi:hypothetical protein